MRKDKILGISNDDDDDDDRQRHFGDNAMQ